MDLKKNLPKGVSRSGRVQKKSSKLTDFLESPDEFSPIKKKFSAKKSRPNKISHSNSDTSNESDFEDIDGGSDNEMKNSFPIQWNQSEASHILNALKDEYSDDEDQEELEGFDEDTNDSAQLDDDDTKDSSSFSQAQSLYLSEKKKSMVKEVSSKTPKAKRKDKGKSRLTAYMLWSKTARPDIVQQNPNMDFSAINKRLGEMWSMVPNAQKYKWQNKAKRVAAKGEKESRGSMISTGKKKKNTNTVKVTTPKRQQPIVKTPKTEPRKQVVKPTYQTPKISKFTSDTMEISPPGTFKASGTSPIDCAAHLKLLGESLNNIGQKLKEHEGQIAVSGSLSVLLDSMLCVLGPLSCLINQVPGLETAISESTRTEILDNIAYIMPGIV